MSSELLISVYQGSASDVKGTVILLLRHVDTSTRATVLSEITNSTTKLDYRPALELASLDKYYAVPEKLISKVALQWKHNSLVNELLNLEKASSAKNQIAQHPPIEQRLSGDFLQSYLAGKYLYQGKTACGACHGAEGKGISSMGPPLVQSEWLADEEILIKVLLKGLTGPVEVNGQKYTPTMVMPGLGDKPSISDQDIANIANYIRNSWSNQASYVSPDSVNNIRKATSGLESPLNSNSISPSKQTSNTSEGKISKKISLFNGKDFTGWKKIGGMGQYRIENAEIIGTAYSSPINTFLATEKQYKDFDLSLEFKVDNRMNSGVQFRSKQLGYFLVKGYQFEIDPSDRSWSGGVYHEAGGGWLFDLSENEKAQQAFKANTWNKARIRVEGSHIQTWINDIPAVDNFDDSHGLGFIALQVHAIWNKPSADAPEIKWRNIFIKEIN